MARFAIIYVGRIINHAEADDIFAASQGWIPAADSRIGDLWDGETFTPAPPPSPVVPAAVTMRQARLALLGAGLLDDVEAAIAGAGPAAKIEWDYAVEVQRSSGLVPAMAVALGMTDEQIDALFIDAEKL